MITIAQFYGTIKINGKILPNYQVVEVDNNSDRKIGTNISVEREDSIGDVPLFIRRKKGLQSFPITLFKSDENGNGTKITDTELKELTRILFAKEDCSIIEFESHKGLVFYGHFVGDSTSWRNAALQGYVKLNLELSSPYPYSYVMVNPIHVTNEKTIELMNISTANENIYADVEFEMLNGKDITITNLSNGKVFTITGMVDNERAYVYGREKEIVSKVDDSRNLFKLTNRNFEAFKMVYGKNRFKVSGNCKINILFQNEIAIY